jgi:hypothetical protein
MPDNKITVKNNEELFNTKLKKSIFESEMKFLDRITGDKDIYLSNNCIYQGTKNNDKTFEFSLINSSDKIILNGICISKSESALSIKSIFGIMNEMVKQIFKEQ